MLNAIRRVHLPRPAHPWFVDPVSPSPASSGRPDPPPPVPKNAPQALKTLHAVLSESPILEQAMLDVCQPVSFPPGPALPVTLPKGRRKRGGTYAGEGVMVDSVGGIWDWFLLAQVKEGAEKRGAIEAVERIVRKTLLSFEPPLPMLQTPRRRLHNGWIMVDAGDFAVHVLSKAVRDRYFQI